MPKPPLIVLTGPTAAGKTALSIALAKAVGGEIISADSMQVYRGMDIGSAKIMPKEMAGVPHHLIDILEPEEDFHVAEFVKRAKEAMEGIRERGHIPIVVGGTGFYIQALLKDIDFSEGDRDSAFREELEARIAREGEEALHRELAAVDPASAEAIHPHNVKRVIRALEYFRETGVPISSVNEAQREQESPYNSACFVLNLPREILYRRIEDRVDRMFAEGLTEEVRRLKDRGCRRGMVSMQGLGYKEVLDHLDGLLSEEEAREKIKTETRHFAKRQLTWFRREKDVIWVEKDEFPDETAVLEQLLAVLRDKKIIDNKEHTMKFVFAPDSFKGSLSSEESIAILTREAKKVFPEAETVGIPMADGGEGTVDALLSACGGEKRHLTVRGPLGEDEQGFYGLLNDGTAVIEMSAASGLPMVPPELRNPEKTSTFGTGELIRDALDNGAERLFICVGGSATNDGGMGAMAALGARFLDEDGSVLSPVGGNLGKVFEIDLSSFDPRIRNTGIRVLCDVKNPLCGKMGATYIFGPQKGAKPEQLERLEAGMENYAALVEQSTGMAVRDKEGAGAAGGLAAALCAFCGGELISGIEAVLEIVDFDRKSEGADLIVTGEGCLDSQSLNGKVVSGIGRHALKAGIPAAAVTGGMKITKEEAKKAGILHVFPLVNGKVTLQESLAHAPEIYAERAAELFALLKEKGSAEE